MLTPLSGTCQCKQTANHQDNQQGLGLEMELVKVLAKVLALAKEQELVQVVCKCHL